MKTSLLIFLLLSVSLNGLAADVTVILHDWVAPSENDVLLSEIASIFGPNRQLVARLNSVFVCSAPEDGETVKVNRSDIKRKLTTLGIDLAQLDIAGPIETIIAPVNGNRFDNPLANRIQSFLSEHFAASNEDLEIHFRHLPEFSRPLSSKEKIELLVTANQKYRGIIVIVAALMEGGKVKKKYPVSVQVNTFQKVAIAVQDISRNQKLDPEQFTLMKRETTRMRQEPVTDLACLKGKRAARSIFRGDVLTVDKLHPIPVVEQGDVVKITAGDDAFSISTLGRARKSGGIGEVIPVINLSSHRQINARIIDETTVVVEF